MGINGGSKLASVRKNSSCSGCRSSSSVVIFSSTRNSLRSALFTEASDRSLKWRWRLDFRSAIPLTCGSLRRDGLADKPTSNGRGIERILPRQFRDNLSEAENRLLRAAPDSNQEGRKPRHINRSLQSLNIATRWNNLLIGRSLSNNLGSLVWNVR
jgi:hypothetical protein